MLIWIFSEGNKYNVFIVEFQACRKLRKLGPIFLFFHTLPSNVVIWLGGVFFSVPSSQWAEHSVSDS